MVKAFPTVTGATGMELRDYFAAKAMQGMLANSAFDTIEGMLNVSVVAYMMADAMLKERENRYDESKEAK
jgi:hypothetical protein